MLPHNFPEANVPMQKPENWKDEDCGTLDVWRGIVPLTSGQTVPAYISFWKPSKEDLETLNNGGGIYVTVLSTGLPPMELSTENPFIHENG